MSGKRLLLVENIAKPIDVDVLLKSLAEVLK